MPAMTTNQAARRFFFILLLLTTVLLALVVRTLASALFLAAVLAGVLWPVHRRLTSWFGERRTVSAGALTVAVIAVIMSTVITAAVQAVVALIGYLIARVPNALFFAGITFFVAFIPAVGAAVVCLAAALLLFVTGHAYMALFLALWGLLVVGLVDNLVKPLLIKAGMEMRGAVVFFALVGGIGTFGAVGLLIGPLVVALFLALLRMYKRDFKPEPV
jgi:predicted PurR-regulated permease PerM